MLFRISGEFDQVAMAKLSLSETGECHVKTETNEA